MTSLGDRLRSVRKRSGLTQTELAASSGVSVSLIRQLEQGTIEDTRLETMHKLASALRVPTSVLSGGRADAERASSEILTEWEPIRRALAGQADQPVEEVTADGVRAVLDSVMPAFHADRYSEVVQVLPDLIRDADALGDEGRDVRARVLRLAGWFLIHTHQYQSAQLVLTRALDNALDRLDASAIVDSLCWLLIRQGKLDECMHFTARWADDFEPQLSRATNRELIAWGWKLIGLSMAAVRDNRPGEAVDALRLARAAAIAMSGDPDDVVDSFSPSMVVMKRAELAMIQDQPDKVLILANSIPPATFMRRVTRPATGRRSWHRHLLDVANAHVRLGQTNEAQDILVSIKNDAPQWLSQQRYAKDVMRAMIGRRRTLTPEMRNLADFVQLEY